MNLSQNFKIFLNNLREIKVFFADTENAPYVIFILVMINVTVWATDWQERHLVKLTQGLTWFSCKSKTANKTNIM